MVWRNKKKCKEKFIKLGIKEFRILFDLKAKGLKSTNSFFFICEIKAIEWHERGREREEKKWLHCLKIEREWVFIFDEKHKFKMMKKWETNEERNIRFCQ